MPKVDLKQFLESNARPLAFSLVGAVIVGLGWILWNDVQSRKEAEAQTALYEVALEAQSEVKSEDDAFKSLDVDQEYPKTVEGLRKIAESFSGTRAAQDACARLGALYFSHKQYEKALTWFERSLKEAKLPLSKALALLNLGWVHESLKQCDQALGFYDQALALHVSASKGELLSSRARCLDILGRQEEAKKVYDQILTEFPESAYARAAHSTR